jgi:hypothetical protein
MIPRDLAASVVIAQRPLAPGSAERVRALLDDAHSHLERVARLTSGYSLMDPADEDRLASRLNGSLTSLRSALERLQRR